jgi:hypothetical protein
MRIENCILIQEALPQREARHMPIFDRYSSRVLWQVSNGFKGKLLVHLDKSLRTHTEWRKRVVVFDHMHLAVPPFGNEVFGSFKAAFNYQRYSQNQITRRPTRIQGRSRVVCLRLANDQRGAQIVVPPGTK